MNKKIEKQNVEDIFELSMAQKGMLFHYLNDQQENLFNAQLSFAIEGDFDHAILNEAFRLVQANNETLRSVFNWEKADKPLQIILKECPLDLSYKEFQATTEAAPDYMASERDRRFDLSALPLRLDLLKTGPASYLFNLTHHHILYDGWSSAIFLQELFSCYTSLASGKQPVLELKPSFRELRKAALRSKDPALGKIYWKAYLKEYEINSFLPATNAADRQDTRIRKLRFTCPSGNVAAFSARYKVTQASIIYTAFGLLLCKYADSRDMTFGTTVSGREATVRNIDKIIGSFINTIPLRVRLPDENTVLQIVEQVNKDLLTRSAYSDISYFEIKQLLELNYGDNLFDAILVVENYPIDERAINSNPAFRIRLQSDYENPDIPLMIKVFLRDEIEIEVLYKHRDVGTAFARSLGNHLAELIYRIAANPDQKATTLSLLTTDQRRQWLYACNATEAPRLPGITALTLFEEQAKSFPHAIAQSCGENELTFAELDLLASRLANYLKTVHAVGNGSLIGLLLHREEYLVPAILGILKAGCAYLPIDPAYPQERINAILRDAGVNVLITRQQDLQPDFPLKVLLNLDQDLPAILDFPPLAPGPTPGTSDLAYVIYTSGSTGKPKGVMIEHGSLANYLIWASGKYVRQERLCFPLYTSISFDLTITSIFLPLITAGTIILYKNEEKSLPIEEVIRENRVDIIKLTPAHLKLLRDNPLLRSGWKSAIKRMIVGGEELESELAAAIFNQFHGEIEIYNEYGPTEATVGCMIHRFDPAETNSGVPIGVPIDNTQIYILDSRLQPLPPEIGGELYISGLGLARGYMGNEELTNSKFIDNPFVAGKKMYRTGDKATRAADGKIIFGGRLDEQVKIRGFRIEPGEIEENLKTYVEEQPEKPVVVDKFESFHTDAGVIRCKNCLLTSNYPGISFNKDGICNVCQEFFAKKAFISGYFKEESELTTYFRNKPAGENKDYDCLLLFSGGKDSTYTLYKLMEMGLRVLTFTFDNGFISKIAFQNIRNSAEKFQVESLIRTSDQINKVLLESLRSKHNACTGCWNSINSIGIQVAQEYRIDTIVSGLSRGQIIEMRLEGLLEAGITDEGEINDNLHLFRKSFHSKDNVFYNLLKGNIDVEFLSRINFIDYFRYDPVNTQGVKDYLKKKGWIQPKDTGLCSTNCVINDVGIYMHWKKKGYHFYEAPLSWDTRLNVIDRESSINELTESFNRKKIDAILDKIGFYDPIRVRDAVVLPREDHQGNKQLVAYYTANGLIDRSALRQHLRSLLPAYMIPAFFVQLDELPLTHNGKIDRKALPEPEISTAEDYVAPAGKKEKLLAGIWSRVLGPKSISVTDNFFALGGDSIKSIQISSKIGAMGYDLSVKEILTGHTIRNLAAKMQELAYVADQSPITGEVRLSPIQSWFFRRSNRSRQHFNQSAMLQFPAGLSMATAIAIFEKVLYHHDALRMVFLEKNGRVIQESTEPGQAPDLTLSDFSDLEDPAPAILQAANTLQAGIDLCNGPLLKLGLFHTRAGDRLLIVIHHLVVDAVSWRILLEDIDTLYRQAAGGKSLTLPLKTDAFKSWTDNLIAYRETPAFRAATTYWETAAARTCLPVKRDDPQGGNTFADSRTLILQLGKPESTRLLKEARQAFNTQLTDLLLSALMLAICRQFGNTAIVVDLEGHGREAMGQDINTSRTVGWFTSIYPVLIEKTSEDLSQLIRQTKERLRAIPNHGMDYLLHNYPEPVLLPTSPETPDDNHARIALNYLGEVDAATENYSFHLTEEHKGDEISPLLPRIYDWTILSFLAGGTLELRLSYSERQYKSATMAAFLEVFETCLGEITDYCCGREHALLTPADLTYKQLSMDRLDQWQSSFAIDDIYPLSPMQGGILFHSLAGNTPDAYFEQKSVTLKGVLDETAVEKSLDDLIARHEILRTAFLQNSHDIPLQLVLKTRKIDFNSFDLRTARRESSREELIREFREKDKKRGFKPDTDVLLRVTLLRTAGDEYELIWSHHHIIMDGWCTNLLWQDFNAFYAAHHRGEKLLLPPARRYSTYINWLTCRDKEESIAYWRGYLTGYESPATIPAAQELSAKTPGYRQETESLVIDKRQTKLLNKISGEYGITVNNILQTAWGILLAKYNDSHDVVFGSVVSGRPAEIEGISEMIGLFINTIPVRVSYDTTTTITALLQKVQQDSMDSEPHHYHPLAEIQSLTGVGRDLVNHIVVFENYPSLAGPGPHNPAGAGKESFEVTNVQVFELTNYDLALIIAPGEEILLRMDYNANTYDQAGIRRLLDRLNNLVDKIIVDAKTRVAEIELVTRTERHELMTALDRTEVGFPHTQNLVDLFRQQAGRNPENIAVRSGQHTLTYRELDHSSDRLAVTLREKGVGRDAIVGLLMDRSIELIIAILGTLKAGGAYLPLDIDYPAERTAYLLRDSGALLLLTAGNPDAESAYPHVPALDIRDTLEAHRQQAAPPPPVPTEAIQPSDLCYVIYTSGTTGQPKGVMIEHRNVVRLLFNDEFQFRFSTDDVWTMFHSQAFDFSVWEIFGALLTGGRLILVPKMTARDPAAFLHILQQERVTVLSQTPGAFYNLMREEDLRPAPDLALRYVVFGGEALAPRKLKRWHDKYPAVRLINMYGITETTVHVTFKEITRAEIERNLSNIGKPIPTLAVYIYDRDQRLTPKGIAGELYIGGSGLARGYLGNPELTGRKFVADPANPQERLYRSGDLARILDSGEIEYLGRLDDQVKIRGFRIELGEIEGQLSACPGITEVAVIARTKAGTMELAAYYVSPAAVTPETLRSYLAGKLPDFMLPARYIRLDALPLTPNGKLDRKALPEPGIIAEDLYEAPQSPEEKLLAEIWSKVLDSGFAGVTDNFFTSGGDSIKSIRIIAGARAAGYVLTARDIFSFPTIRQLAPRMKKTSDIPDQSPVTGKSPLSPIQRWFFSTPTPARHHFNQSVLLQFPGGLSRKWTERLLGKLLEHHDALRMVCREENGTIILENKGPGVLPFPITESDLRDAADPAAALLAAATQLQCGVDLPRGPLLKTGLFHLRDGSRLLIVAHHLIIDTVSWRILLEDLATLHRQLTTEQPLKVPFKTMPFLSWPLRLREYRNTPAALRAKEYWEKTLRQSYPAIPPDYPTGENSLRYYDRVSFLLPQAITAKLLTETHSAFHTRINDILLAGLALAAYRQYGLNRIGIDLEGHGREEILPGTDLSRTVGWFTTIFPVLLEVGDPDPTTVIVRIKEALRDIPNNGIDYLLLAYPDPDAKTSPLTPANRPGISFNYLGQIDPLSADSPFFPAMEDKGPENAPDEIRPYDWTINGRVEAGALEMELLYSSRRYRAGSVRDFMAAFRSSLELLIRHCSSLRIPQLTPSDMTFRELPAPLLNRLQQEYEVEDIYPLSPLQEGMLFHALLDPASDNYFEQMTCRIKGRLDVPAIKKSLDDLVARHPALRTVFLRDGFSRPLQIVMRHRQAAFEFHAVEANDPDETEELIRDYQQRDRSCKFDLARDPLIRLTVLHTGPEEYALIWSHPHIIMDGWCMTILFNEFTQLYAANLHGTIPALAEAGPYSRYIDWLGYRDQDSSADYWKQALAGYETCAGLPRKTRDQQEAPPYSPAFRETRLGRQDTASLHRTCRAHGVTMNTVLQAVWGILLGKFNDVNDAVFASVVSGRTADIEGIASIIGLFINTIPVRIAWSETDTFADLVRNTQQQALDSEPHHFTPLARIQAFSTPGRDLVDHIFIFENYPEAAGPDTTAGEKEGPFAISNVTIFEQTNYDLALEVYPGEEIRIRFNYNANTYDDQTIEDAIAYFNRILEQVLADNDIRIAGITLLSTAEKHRLLEAFSGPARPLDDSIAYPGLFAEQAAKTPNALAIEHNGVRLTYAELHQRSAAFAAGLYAKGVRPGTIVAIYLPRGIDMLISILAVFQSGGAYLPVETDYPVHRVEQILADSKSAYVITTPDAFPLIDGINARLGTVREKLSPRDYASLALPAPAIAAGITDLAYLIYTSGSTGKPKGVMIRQQGMINHLYAKIEALELNQGDHIAQTASASFDISVWQFLAGLLVGASVYVIDTANTLDPRRLAADLRAGEITIFESVPSLISALLDHLPARETEAFSHLRWMIPTGEHLTVSLTRKWYSRFPGIKLMNAYGPTEASDDITHYIVEPPRQEQLTIPIGRPIRNTRIYILDARLDLCAPGINGEIFVAGPGVGAGYYHDAAKTRQAFLPNPFAALPRDADYATMYKTGDIGCYLRDGNITCLGRTDHQVKIRGYRIELAEVQSQLLRYEDISAATLLAKGEGTAKRLVAYYVAGKQIDPADLETFLSALLPAYMLPAHYIQLTALPLTPNGKIDHKALPDPANGTTILFHPLTGDTEEKLAGIWSLLLDKDSSAIGALDDFFRLGGHSLSAMSLINRIEKTFHVNIPLKILLQVPTLREMASYITALQPEAGNVELREDQEQFVF
jgi:amino acid adenylation domain-containing protein/non-ribosomal peptide synthase protein (TIGR01720 family)